MRQGQYDVNRLNYGRDLSVAGLTAPQLVNTGSSGTQSGTQQGMITQNTNPFGTIASLGASVAPVSL